MSSTSITDLSDVASGNQHVHTVPGRFQFHRPFFFETGFGELLILPVLFFRLDSLVRADWPFSLRLTRPPPNICSTNECAGSDASSASPSGPSSRHEGTVPATTRHACARARHSWSQRSAEAGLAARSACPFASQKLTARSSSSARSEGVHGRANLSMSERESSSWADVGEAKTQRRSWMVDARGIRSHSPTKRNASALSTSLPVSSQLLLVARFCSKSAASAWRSGASRQYESIAAPSRLSSYSPGITDGCNTGQRLRSSASMALRSS